VSATFLHGDAFEMLKTLESDSIQVCVTSPPYWMLRDYNVVGQIGLEKTPEDYILRLVDVFREVRRVLKPDGTLWVNISDTYSGQSGGFQGKTGDRNTRAFRSRGMGRKTVSKPKDLIGIPWMLAFALRADGWYLRSEIIWHKPNPMPESVLDRPTLSHEKVFLLSRSEKYFYNAAAIAEPSVEDESKRAARREAAREYPAHTEAAQSRQPGNVNNVGIHARHQGAATRNARNVWTISSQPFAGAHFAVMPPELARRCVLAGSKPGDTVLDPFNGAGTTGLVSLETMREYVGIELNAEYLEITNRRLEHLTSQIPLFLPEVSA
jgi:DNA modification methylase